VDSRENIVQADDAGSAATDENGSLKWLGVERPDIAEGGLIEANRVVEHSSHARVAGSLSLFAQNYTLQSLSSSAVPNRFKTLLTLATGITAICSGSGAVRKQLRNVSAIRRKSEAGVALLM
jgi:hypothetical protein